MIINKLINKIESRFIKMNFNFNYLSEWLERDLRDCLTIEYLQSAIKKRNEHASVTAIYRVKNGAQFIELSILSVASICREIIVVDNGSTDLTIQIVERLKSELRHICEIRIYHYTISVALAGNNYDSEIKKFPEKSLAKYYNYAFSLGTSDFLMKCDSHYIYTPAGIHKIQNKLINNPSYNDVISFRGMEIFGAILACEPYLVRKGCFEYYDVANFEAMKLKNRRSLIQRVTSKIYNPCFIHVKRLAYIKALHLNDLKPVEYLYKQK